MSSSCCFLSSPASVAMSIIVNLSSFRACTMVLLVASSFCSLWIISRKSLMSVCMSFIIALLFLLLFLSFMLFCNLAFVWHCVIHSSISIMLILSSSSLFSLIMCLISSIVYGGSCNNNCMILCSKLVVVMVKIMYAFFINLWIKYLNNKRLVF